uniref:PH domain-containing protein n=1 Tax=Gongylonema pulchrum TaxID=637853 RepID=A0A183D5Z8_9BILA
LATSFFTDRNRNIGQHLTALLVETNQEIPDWLEKMGGEGFRSFSKYGDKTRVGRFGGRDQRSQYNSGNSMGFHHIRSAPTIQDPGNERRSLQWSSTSNNFKPFFGRGDSRSGFMNSAGSNAFQSNTSSVPPAPYNRGTAHNNFNSPTHNIAGDRWNGGINSQHGRFTREENSSFGRRFGALESQPAFGNWQR